MRSLEDSTVEASEWQGIVATIKSCVHSEMEKTRNAVVKAVQEEGDSKKQMKMDV